MKSILTPKQERFCQEYIKDLNGRQAAIRAGYSEKTANEQASQLLAKLHIASRVAELKGESAERLKIDADEILRELHRLAMVDVTQAFDDMGGLKPFKEMPEDVRKAIAGLEVSEIFEGSGDQRTAIGLLKKIRMWDKPRALELLGKHLSLFIERHEHTGKGGGPIETRNLSDEELDKRIEALSKKRGGS